MSKIWQYSRAGGQHSLKISSQLSSLNVDGSILKQPWDRVAPQKIVVKNGPFFTRIRHLPKPCSEHEPEKISRPTYPLAHIGPPHHLSPLHAIESSSAIVVLNSTTSRPLMGDIFKALVLPRHAACTPDAPVRACCPVAVFPSPALPLLLSWCTHLTSPISAPGSWTSKSSPPGSFFISG